MASYTNPILHATGDDLAVTDYNAVANNTVFLAQKPYVMAYNSVATSVPSGAFTQITLGGLTASGYGFSVSSNNLVVPLTGVYWVSGAVQFPSLTATDYLTQISHNGAAILIARSAATATIGLPVSGLVSCSAGDTLSLLGFQDSGSPVSTSNGANLTFLHSYFVGFQ